MIKTVEILSLNDETQYFSFNTESNLDNIKKKLKDERGINIIEQLWFINGNTLTYNTEIKDNDDIESYWWVLLILCIVIIIMIAILLKKCKKNTTKIYPKLSNKIPENRVENNIQETTIVTPFYSYPDIHINTYPKIYPDRLLVNETYDRIHSDANNYALLNNDNNNIELQSYRGHDHLNYS